MPSRSTFSTILISSALLQKRNEELYTLWSSLSQCTLHPGPIRHPQLWPQYETYIWSEYLFIILQGSGQGDSNSFQMSSLVFQQEAGYSCLLWWYFCHWNKAGDGEDSAGGRGLGQPHCKRGMRNSVLCRLHCLNVHGILVPYDIPNFGPSMRHTSVQYIGLLSCKAVTKVAATAFGCHLWYLSKRLVVFAFYDDNFAIETKQGMVKTLQEEEDSDNPSWQAVMGLTFTAQAKKM